MDVRDYQEQSKQNGLLQGQRIWSELSEHDRLLLAEIIYKMQIVQTLDDGYGKIVVNIQRGKVFEIKMMQEKIVKPLKDEVV